MQKQIRSKIAIVASYLILFQLFVPFAFAGLDKTLICNVQGATEVVIGSDGKPVELPNLQHHCKLCFANTPNDVAVIGDIVTPLLSYAVLSANLTAQKSQLISNTPSGFASRAPPTLS